MINSRSNSMFYYTSLNVKNRFFPKVKAFGTIEIGDNVFVAPNAIFTKFVHSNIIAGGMTAMFLKEKKLDKNKVYAQYHKS